MIVTAATTTDEVLRSRIKAEGPITFADWMRTALYSPEGYYFREDTERWGRRGDYRTSPERSSLFAATFARYFASLYEQLGRPAEWTIVDVGAGNGALAEGVLQTLQRYFPDVFTATAYVIDEISPDSRVRVNQRLSRFAERVSFGSLNETHIECGVVFSNELLDAFPVHLVKMEKGELKEMYVDVNRDHEFKFVIGEPSTPRLADYLTACGVPLSEGQTVEINLEIEAWLKTVATSLKHGFVITVDYGAETSDLFSRTNGTLRAFKSHSLSNELLNQPGTQDLTSTVDWSLVKRFGEELGMSAVAFERQDRFLIEAGLPQQLEMEMAGAASEAEKLALTTSAREMILPDGMARDFQVLVQRK